MNNIFIYYICFFFPHFIFKLVQFLQYTKCYNPPCYKHFFHFTKSFQKHSFCDRTAAFTPLPPQCDGTDAVPTETVWDSDPSLRQRD